MTVSFYNSGVKNLEFAEVSALMWIGNEKTEVKPNDSDGLNILIYFRTGVRGAITR